MGQDWQSDSAREIWDNEVSQLAPSLAGIKYSRLEGDGLQWPCTHDQHPGTCFLHKDGEFTCGLGQFIPVDWTPPAEVADEEYPFVLSTGRRLYHYHTRTQTGRCRGLNDLLSEETADISLEDAKALHIEPDEKIRVKSRRGEVTVKARITPEMPKGMVWMAFHFREACANWLTNPVFDPITLTAEYKACAVTIEKIDALGTTIKKCWFPGRSLGTSMTLPQDQIQCHTSQDNELILNHQATAGRTGFDAVPGEIGQGFKALLLGQDVQVDHAHGGSIEVGHGIPLPQVHTGQIKSAFAADIHPLSRLVRCCQINPKVRVNIVTDRTDVAVDAPVMATQSAVQEFLTTGVL